MTAEEFKAIRKQAGLSANGLASLLRLSDGSNVRKIERGVNGVSGPVSMLMELLRDGVLKPLNPKRKTKMTDVITQPEQADYSITLDEDGSCILLKHDNPKAQRAFDGASIHHAPEQYPATICAFEWDKPKYPGGSFNEDPLSMPVSCPKTYHSLTSTTVNNRDEWVAVAGLYKQTMRVSND